MKVILNQDIPKLGKKFDLKEVSDGYARNMLFPKKLAVPADEISVKKINLILQTTKKEEQDFLEHLKAVALNLKKAPLIFKLKADDKNHPFGSVSKDQIQKALQKNKLLDSTKIEIKLDRPIRTFGEHEIEVHFKKGVSATLRIKVECE